MGVLVVICGDEMLVVGLVKLFGVLLESYGDYCMVMLLVIVVLVVGFFFWLLDSESVVKSYLVFWNYYF